MECPKCAKEQSDVVDSRATIHAVRRRRQCAQCGYRFTTYERVERPRLIVIKKDGRREPYVRDKLVGGLERACQKREVAIGQLDTLTDAIERELFDRSETEVTSQYIGEQAMAHLARVDEVAYIRFASVYRQFSDKEAFATVVEMLEQK